LSASRSSEPTQAKFFYGWAIVGVMASANAVSMAMASLNFGLFIKPMGDDLGAGRAMFGWAGTAQLTASGITSPFVGRLIDRAGSRTIMPAAALVTGGAMVGLAFINDAWQMVALFTVMGVIGLNGAGMLALSVPITKWFVRDRGKAFAFMGLGIPIGALAFVPLTQILIESRGWREAWVILAVLGMVVIVPLAAVFVRRNPEDMGLLPDGLPAPDSRTGLSAAPLEVAWTVRQAVRSRSFWMLAAAIGTVWFATNTVALHRIASFEDRGLDAGVIAVATALDAVCAGASAFTMGLLARRLRVRLLGAAGFAMLAAATMLTISVSGVPMLFASMMLFGAGIGGMIFLQNIVWADYFGREYAGSIRGLSTPVVLIGGSLGAPIAGYVFDSTGTYNVVWWTAVGLLIAAALTVLVTRPPGRPGAR
jgi:MFS family permease